MKLKNDHDYRLLYQTTAPVIKAHFELLFPDEKKRKKKVEEYYRYRIAILEQAPAMYDADPQDVMQTELYFLCRETALLSPARVEADPGYAKKWLREYEMTNSFTGKELDAAFSTQTARLIRTAAAMTAALPEEERLLLWIYAAYSRDLEKFLPQETGLTPDDLAGHVVYSLTFLLQQSDQLQKGGIDIECFNLLELLQYAWTSHEYDWMESRMEEASGDWDKMRRKILKKDPPPVRVYENVWQPEAKADLVHVYAFSNIFDEDKKGKKGKK